MTPFEVTPRLNDLLDRTKELIRGTAGRFGDTFAMVRIYQFVDNLIAV
jgi:hypothetical protein